MCSIILKKSEKYFLDKKYFLVKNGKVRSWDILENGKNVINENIFKKGEIIGNFFNCLSKDIKILVPEVGIEIEALENETELEEIDIPLKDLIKNSYLEKIINHLIRTNFIKFLYQLYDTKGYILAILKFYADGDEKLLKTELKYENFSISKSQFYLVYSKLKEEKYIKEREKSIYLNIRKIDNYLKKFEK